MRPLPQTLAISLTLLALAACQAPTAVPPTPTPTPAPLAQELILHNWEDDLPQSVIEAFTAEYGVQVKYVMYEAQEDAAANLRAGERYDVVVLGNEFVPLMAQEGLLAPLDHTQLPNFKNISPNFLNLAYDPNNEYSVPYNWGTTGILVPADWSGPTINRWADLFEANYEGPLGMWGTMRFVFSFALKATGRSANAETASDIEAALALLLTLQDRGIVNVGGSAPMVQAFVEEHINLGFGFGPDAITSRDTPRPLNYVLPREGSILWGDNFTIPANAPNPATALVFLDFLMRPEIAAQITNNNHYATPNTAALPFIEPALRDDPVIFPPEADIQNAEIMLPLSPEGQARLEAAWATFLATVPER